MLSLLLDRPFVLYLVHYLRSCDRRDEGASFQFLEGYLEARAEDPISVNQTIEIVHPRVVQKSYRTEKRSLCVFFARVGIHFFADSSPRRHSSFCKVIGGSTILMAQSTHLSPWATARSIRLSRSNVWRLIDGCAQIPLETTEEEIYGTMNSLYVPDTEHRKSVSLQVKVRTEPFGSTPYLIVCRCSMTRVVTLERSFPVPFVSFRSQPRRRTARQSDPATGLSIPLMK